MICLPAPIANSVSVAVGDSETIRWGGVAAGEPDATTSTTRSVARTPRRSLDTNPPFREGFERYGIKCRSRAVGLAPIPFQARGRFSDSGLPLHRLPSSRASGRWRRASPLTAAGPSRTRTGFPYRAPFAGSLSSGYGQKGSGRPAARRAPGAARPPGRRGERAEPAPRRRPESRAPGPRAADAQRVAQRARVRRARVAGPAGAAAARRLAALR